MLEAALLYHDRGWSVFPLSGKLPKVPWKDFSTTRPTQQQVIQWWKEWPDAGIGVALGQVSGIIRVDADGQAACDQLKTLGGMPNTAEFTTPSGGRGWLLSFMDGSVTERLWKGPGQHEELRIQSTGAYTVLPPSPHPAGGCYQWVQDIKPAAIPAWLRDRFVERVLRDLVRELRPTLKQPDRAEIAEALKHISAEDYDTWVQVGMALHSAGDDFLPLWEQWSSSGATYKEGECAAKWASFTPHAGGLTTRSILYWAEQQGWKLPNRHEPLTDLGNARILARMGEGTIAHSSKWGWLAWDGKRWAIEGAEKRVQELQKKVLEYRLNRAMESMVRVLRSDKTAEGWKDQVKRKQRTVLMIRKHEEEPRIRGARTLAESEPSIAVDYRQFDSNIWLFNCANGTLDLVTGDLREHNVSDLLSQISDTPFVPTAKCPVWDKFLVDILPDPTVREFLQQFFGTCLTGDVTTQLMPVFWGGGANGKSTLINAVMFVLGDCYAMKAKRDFLMSKRHAEHPTSIARLFGKRFVACVETEESARLDETLVKELTGSDVIAARRMREDEWEFVPTHKPVLVTNHKPEVRGTDDAIWRRLPLIPFVEKFPEGDPRRDPELPDKLKAEREGILRWMVEGCQTWLANGRRLERPEAVKEASAQYRQEQDKIGAFLDDCVVKREGAKIRIEKLTELYTSWCFRNKHQQLNGNAFGRALTERGFPLEGKGSKYRLGLELRTET